MNKHHFENRFAAEMQSNSVIHNHMQVTSKCFGNIYTVPKEHLYCLFKNLNIGLFKSSLQTGKLGFRKDNPRIQCLSQYKWRQHTSIHPSEAPSPVVVRPRARVEHVTSFLTSLKHPLLHNDTKLSTVGSKLLIFSDSQSPPWKWTGYFKQLNRRLSVSYF